MFMRTRHRFDAIGGEDRLGRQSSQDEKCAGRTRTNEALAVQTQAWCMRRRKWERLVQQRALDATERLARFWPKRACTCLAARLPIICAVNFLISRSKGLI